MSEEFLSGDMTRFLLFDGVLMLIIILNILCGLVFLSVEEVVYGD